MKIFQHDNINEFLDIPDEVFLLAYRGSIAHGMYVPKNDPNSIDDVDLMGFVLGSIEHYFGLREWGSRGTVEIKEGHYDVVYYEIKKAVTLLLQGNPNILGMLWTRPADFIVTSHIGRALINNRSLFRGKHVYNAFAGYAHSQLTKMESRKPAEIREYLGVTAELKRRGLHPNHKGDEIMPHEDHPKHFAEWGPDRLFARLSSFQKRGENLGYMGDKRKRLVLEHGYDAKNAAHLIRLLRMCIEFMQTGDLIVYRENDRDELLSIKRGEWALKDVKELANQLFEDAKKARDLSELPEGPDKEKVENILVTELLDHFERGH